MSFVILTTLLWNAVILRRNQPFFVIWPYENETISFWMPVAAHGLQPT